MVSRIRALSRLLGGCLFVTMLGASAASAQTSTSAALAQELAKLLQAGKLDTIAARHGSEADRFMAALYFPGQLLVVSAKYAVPPILAEKLRNKAYRDVYLDLNGASVVESKVFIQDVGADGLKANSDGAADGYDRGVKIRWAFNGDWRKQQMASEEEYLKNYSAADAEYAEILTALIQQLKKTS